MATRHEGSQRLFARRFAMQADSHNLLSIIGNLPELADRGCLRIKRFTLADRSIEARRPLSELFNACISPPVHVCQITATGSQTYFHRRSGSRLPPVFGACWSNNTFVLHLGFSTTGRYHLHGFLWRWVNTCQRTSIAHKKAAFSHHQLAGVRGWKRGSSIVFTQRR